MNSDDLIQAILEETKDIYQAEEYPALLSQAEQWQKTKPFEGVRILDNTPLFTNTLLKFVPLLAAGAELTVAINDAIPYDPALIPKIKSWGLATLHHSKQEKFDCILDCAGANSHLLPNKGYVELTRSGFYHYQNVARPVILVDDSRIKQIETCLGTGDGFLRGMKELGLTPFNSKKIVIFGLGKVGRGIAYYAHLHGAEVVAVDLPTIPTPNYVQLIDKQDVSSVIEAVETAWCIVTVTGIKGAMKGNGVATEIMKGEQLVVAMGIEDEWGGELPKQRILNQNQPLNFMLKEPTQMRYIDPTMALSNAAALEIMTKTLPNGIQKISPEMEAYYWQIVEKQGLITSELHGADL